MTATAASKPRLTSRAPRHAHKDAVYVYERPSTAGGLATWWGDFRRYRDVGGRQEALSKYLLPDELPIRDGERARMVYWRGAEQYKKRRENQATSPIVDMLRATPPGTPSALSTDASETVELHEPAETTRPITPTVTWIVRDAAADSELRLRSAATEYLIKKRARAQNNDGASSTCDNNETSFKALCRILGPDTRLIDISNKMVDAYIATRFAEPGWKKGTLIQTRTVRNELHALSGLFSVLIAKEGYTGPNPVSMVFKPPTPKTVAEYVQLAEFASMLDAAVEIDKETAAAVRAMELVHTVRSRGARGRPTSRVELQMLEEAELLYPADIRNESRHRRFPHQEALIATFGYTGGRLEEVRGLDAADINWSRNRVQYRPNTFRSLKGESTRRGRSTRAVPMESELQRILRAHQELTGIESGLLFKSHEGGMLGALQTIFPRVCERAGIMRELSPNCMRHTYATAMLHTFAPGPNGELVQRSAFEVAKLLGHKTSGRVDDTYGHLDWDAGMMESFSLDHIRKYPSTRLIKVETGAHATIAPPSRVGDSRSTSRREQISPRSLDLRQEWS